MAKIQNAANSTEESIGIAMSRTELFFEKNGKALTLGLIVLVLLGDLFCIWNIRIHIECCLYIGCNHFYIIRYNITRMHICVKVLHADCLVLICAFNPRIYLTLFVRTASHPLFILLFNFFLQRQL